MSSARRPRLSAGIAMLGAGVVLATTPAVVGPPEIAGGVGGAVALTAGLFDPYIDLFTNTFDNLRTIGAHWLDDPLPVLVQVGANWHDYLHTAVQAFADAGQSFVDGMMNLPGQLQTLFDAISDGDIEEALAQLIITVLSAFPVPALIDRLLSIPYDIVGNFVSASMAALHAWQVPIGTAALSAIHATVAETQSVAGDFADDLHSGDLTGALTVLFAAPARVLDATLNSETPDLAGLLTPFQDLNQTGFADAVVNYLPQTVAEAIGADPISDLA